MVLNILLNVNTFSKCFVFDSSQGEVNVKALNIETAGVMTPPLVVKKRGSCSYASTVGANAKYLSAEAVCPHGLRKNVRQQWGSF